MASLYDTSATKALNEDKYINSIYDATLNAQKDAIRQGYDNSNAALSSGQDATRSLTDAYVDRTNVEAGRIAAQQTKANEAAPLSGYTGNSSGTAAAQTRLTLGNQKAGNLTALQKQQQAVDMEFDRIRNTMAQQYTAQLEKAQADNDLARYQQLYEAAKAEDDQLRALRQDAASLLASKNDYSIAQEIAAGAPIQRDTESETWQEVLKDQDSVNKIYDAALQSKRIQAQSDYSDNLSRLAAEQQKSARQTDAALTSAYVDALRNGKNYRQVQSAYGQGSGTAAAAQLARDTALTKRLTDLRTLQMGKDAASEAQKVDLARNLAQTISDSTASVNADRNKALYTAAENQEQNLIADQKAAGQLLAKNNDYSILGALYGLTPEQMQKLAPSGGGGEETRSSGMSNATSKAINFVNNMLGNLTSSRSNPQKVINGTNVLNSAQKEIANAYLDQVLKNGAMK